MNKLLDTNIKKIEVEFISALQDIMKIKSVKEPATKDAPFGEGPKEALLKALSIADSLGFKTKLIDNAIGYAQLGEDNENYIGVFGHLDVVDAGSGWDYPPYDLTLDDDIFYGRGILDNKGPLFANLYALAILKRSNYPLNKTIRIIFGTDEESGSADIPIYLASEQEPMYGYTPDCKYPAVYGERGMVSLTIQTTINDSSIDNIDSISGEYPRSAVPDYAFLKFINDEKIVVNGKRSPSNAPELGLNAITLLANELSDSNKISGELKKYMKWVNSNLHNDHSGQALGIDFSDSASGKLSLTPISMNLTNNQLDLDLSIRYPISIKEDNVLDTIQKSLPLNSKIKVLRSLPSTMFPTEHPMINSMTKVYENITGLDGTPVTTTGATYARTVPNIIAFGPSFPGQKGIAHNSNEYMTKSDLMMQLKIYTYLLSELGV